MIGGVAAEAAQLRIGLRLARDPDQQDRGTQDVLDPQG